MPKYVPLDDSCQEFVVENYLNVAVSDAQSNLGIRRSKVSKVPDLVPCKPQTLRNLLREEAAGKAWRCFRRFGEKSYQFQRAVRSRWIQYQGA